MTIFELEYIQFRSISGYGIVNRMHFMYDSGTRLSALEQNGFDKIKTSALSPCFVALFSCLMKPSSRVVLEGHQWSLAG
jgi:hypothetical protein